MTTVQKPEMQQQMQADLGLADEDFAYHATDLYVVALPGVWEWLQKNHPHPRNVTTFISQVGSGWNGAGKLCYDIPFMGK